MIYSNEIFGKAHHLFLNIAVILTNRVRYEQILSVYKTHNNNISVMPFDLPEIIKTSSTQSLDI